MLILGVAACVVTWLGLGERWATGYFRCRGEVWPGLVTPPPSCSLVIEMLLMDWPETEHTSPTLVSCSSYVGISDNNELCEGPLSQTKQKEAGGGEGWGRSLSDVYVGKQHVTLWTKTNVGKSVYQPCYSREFSVFRGAKFGSHLLIVGAAALACLIVVYTMFIVYHRHLRFSLGLLVRNT